MNRATASRIYRDWQPALARVPEAYRVNLIASLSMADCRACGAPVTWAVVKDTDPEVRIPIDEHAASGMGDERYIIVEQSSPPVVEKVRPDYAADAFPDHRTLCQRR